jgi:outer membrane protein TolC
VIAEQDFSGSIAQADAARAQRLPRISLSGNIARQQILTGDERISGSVFSVGPVQISVPVFNGGQRDAQVKAADARVDEARIAYAARIRQALSEVNQALIQLNSSLDTLQQLQ